MTTKDVLLVVGGVALGYWASTKNWGKNTASAVSEVATGVVDTASGVVDTATGVVTDVKDVVVDTKKTIVCEKKWQDEIGSLSRFASAEAMEKSKSDYVKTCVAS
jgi:hypothetical protein